MKKVEKYIRKNSKSIVEPKSEDGKTMIYFRFKEKAVTFESDNVIEYIDEIIEYNDIEEFLLYIYNEYRKDNSENCDEEFIGSKYHDIVKKIVFDAYYKEVKGEE